MSKENCSIEAECCTPQDSSCTTSQESECCDMPEKLLCLADEAWEELVKEKIKAQIQECCGSDLDQLAKFVAETNKAKWKTKISARQQYEEYRQTLRQMITSFSSRT